ncbi:MAG: Glucose-induced degradation complex subunit, partial [Paramarteilia canceri]
HQKLIEMVRNRSEITKLIEFAQQNLADLSVDDTNLLEEMEKTLALAIFDEPNECPFAYLLSQTQRQNTAMYINDAILAHQGNKSTPNLVGMIETMLTMQKDLENCKINAPKIKNIKKCEFVD